MRRHSRIALIRGGTRSVHDSRNRNSARLAKGDMRIL